MRQLREIFESRDRFLRRQKLELAQFETGRTDHCVPVYDARSEGGNGFWRFDIFGENVADEIFVYG